MALAGPVIIVDDDDNDAEVIAAALRENGITNAIKIMATADLAYDYLCTTDDQPHVILCDIRMPGLDGLAFRKRILESEPLKKKSVPFVFFTGLLSDEIVNSAYDLEVQGFFQKATSYERMREQLALIFLYWKHSAHPNRPVPHAL